MPGGLPQEMFGEQPSARTAFSPTNTFPPITTVAGTTGLDGGSPGVTASSSAPGATVRFLRTTIVPAGAKHTPVMSIEE
jgi:hypothetical protein